MGNFKPLFKEKTETKEQFYFENDSWIKCSESRINSLWSGWVVSKNVHRYFDEQGFLVYGNLSA